MKKTILKSDSFYNFNRLFRFSTKLKRLNLRPFCYFFIKFSGYTIPEFVIEFFNVFSFSYFLGHHEFCIVMRIFKFEWLIDIRKKNCDYYN